MMTLNKFNKEYILKIKATLNIKIQQVLSSLSLDGVGIYLRDGPFKFDISFVNLRPSKGIHRVCFIKENYFYTYGCVCPKKVSKFIIKRNKHCLLSEYQIQKIDSCCASCCL